MAEQLTVHTIRPSNWNGVDAFMAALRNRFSRFLTGVTFLAGTEQVLDDGSLDSVRIDDCAGVPTDDVVGLFDRFASTLDPARELAVFFAHQLAGPSGPSPATGCANHPAGTRGVVIRCTARPLTLPHEICHLYNLDHVDDPEHRNLMVQFPETILGDGLLIPSQVEAIGAGLGGFVPAADVLEVLVGAHEETVARPRRKRRVARPKPRPRRRQVSGPKRPRSPAKPAGARRKTTARRKASGSRSRSSSKPAPRKRRRSKK